MHYENTLATSVNHKSNYSASFHASKHSRITEKLELLNFNLTNLKRYLYTQSNSRKLKFFQSYVTIEK